MIAKAFEKIALHRQELKKNSKRLFWVWVVYQAIKGSMTTAFIWIPAIYLWLGK